MSYDLYQDIVEKSEKGPVQLEFVDLPVKPETEEGRCLKMKGHDAPWSLRLSEFHVLRRYIINHSLRNGIEIATGFGISALAAGLAMKWSELDTPGKLLTIDSYAEERTGTWNGYIHDDHTEPIPHVGEHDGFKCASWLIKEHGLEDTVDLAIGWSPEDIPGLSQKRGQYDYAFIDGGHFDHQLLQDLEAIKPFMGEKFAIFLHDTHGFTPETMGKVRDMFGIEPKTFTETIYPKGFSLSIIDSL